MLYTQSVPDISIHHSSGDENGVPPPMLFLEESSINLGPILKLESLYKEATGYSRVVLVGVELRVSVLTQQIRTVHSRRISRMVPCLMVRTMRVLLSSSSEV